MNLWITADPFGQLSTAERDAAAAAGAAVIVHGVPPSLAGMVPLDTLGLVEIEDPTPATADPPPDPLTTLLARLADAQSLEEVRQAAQEATQS